MSWLDEFLTAYNTLQQNGVPAVQRRVLNFLNATVTDDAANQRSNITVSASLSVTGSGFVHVSSGSTDAAASHGAAGQLPFGGANDITWTAPSGDLSLSASVLGKWTVLGLQGQPISSATPQPGQVLSFVGGQWVATYPAQQTTPQRLSAATIVAASQAGTTFYCNTTSAAFTVTLAMTGMPDGAEFTFIDDHAQWNVHALSVTTDAGTIPVVDPALIGTTGGTATTVVLSEIRASITFKYDQTQNMFLVK